ncbi:MAG: phage major capsid protein [Firmicutes bacterium]|nr:phage major capsid protein [Bacillota bacterium]
MLIKEMNMEQVEARLAEIREELKAEGADLDALSNEADELNERKSEIAKNAEKRDAVIKKVVQLGGSPAAPAEKSAEEVRNSKEYISAFETYIRTGDASECRSLLTDNASGGTVPVPAFVEEIVKTAWENDKIAGKVRRTYLKGNVKQGFEISGSDAATHTEGGAAVSEGTIVDGIVEMVPQDIMKWVSISRETYNLRGEEFLRYIYEHLTKKIVKAAVKSLITKIDACTTVATTTQVNVGVVTSTTVGIGLVAQAMAELSDQADNPVVMMNKSTWGALKDAQANNKYGYDPFEGLEVCFCNDIAAFSAATTGDVYMIVGDMEEGAQFNLPNGDDVHFIFDEVTSASAGMIRIYGDQMVGIGVVAPKAFTKVVK